ncbi:hypothetical protein BcepIL02_gp25 [Burkholderia phage BcepIL02]|uniref:Uncharacterized protein n=1 Tax=Burkholderia phage BcepIL02 TaxID=2886898 RepID=C5IHL7_9CAUD|nr:hypothetical protein BcepIL02_gp25 [Burkholderia phage BcepIL02]ACR15018.1 hypothetical protein BcepIL02_gp25 [Burkholderia phage BcepIL02]
MLKYLIARIRALLRPEPLLHFYWIGEKSEVFVARSLDEALDAFAQPDDLIDRAWGPVSRYYTVCYRVEETGETRIETLEEMARGCRVLPTQLLSQYC